MRIRRGRRAHRSCDGEDTFGGRRRRPIQGTGGDLRFRDHHSPGIHRAGDLHAGGRTRSGWRPIRLGLDRQCLRHRVRRLRHGGRRYRRPDRPQAVLRGRTLDFHRHVAADRPDPEPVAAQSAARRRRPRRCSGADFGHFSAGTGVRGRGTHSGFQLPGHRVRRRSCVRANGLGVPDRTPGMALALLRHRTDRGLDPDAGYATDQGIP